MKVFWGKADQSTRHWLSFIFSISKHLSLCVPAKTLCSLRLTELFSHTPALKSNTHGIKNNL